MAMPMSPSVPSGQSSDCPGEVPPEVQDRPPRRHRHPNRRHEALTGWGFMAPFALMFILVFLVPILVSVRQSFYKQTSAGGLYGGGGLTNHFVGMENYHAVVTSTAFWRGMGRVVGYGAFQIPVMIILALVLALLIDSWLVRRVTPFRLGFFLPYAIPGVVAAMVWLYMYTPEISPLVKVLQTIGIDIDFMSSNVILFSMANMTTWTYTGYNMLIFLAALQAIPQELYEAARIDGASEWKVVTQVKVPMVGSAALLAVLLSIIGTVQLFNEPAVMATVNPWMGKDYMPMLMAYNSMMGGISPSGEGPASAISIVMALLAGILAVIYAMVQRRLAR